MRDWKSYTTSLNAFVLAIIFLLSSVCVRASERACALSTQEGLVFTTAALISPESRQCAGTCYFETGVGLVQDTISRELVKAGVPADKQVQLVKSVPMALLIGAKFHEFLGHEPEKNLEKPSGFLVSTGTLDEMMTVIKGIAIPLFASGNREANAGVSSMVTLSQMLMNRAIEQGKSREEINTSVGKALSYLVANEISNPENSGYFFHVSDAILLDGILSDVPGFSAAKVAEKVQAYVNSEATAAIVLKNPPSDFGPKLHMVRLAGYRLGADKKIAEVWVHDSNVKPDESSVRPIPFHTFFDALLYMANYEIRGSFVKGEGGSGSHP